MQFNLTRELRFTDRISPNLHNHHGGGGGEEGMGGGGGEGLLRLLPPGNRCVCVVSYKTNQLFIQTEMLLYTEHGKQISQRHKTSLKANKATVESYGGTFDYSFCKRQNIYFSPERKVDVDICERCRFGSSGVWVGSA